MYRSMIKMYYRGVSVALVVYDVGDRASFECIGDWLKDVREKQQQRVLSHSDGSGKEDCLYYVIGNKCDLDDEGLREVSYEEGEQWVQDYVEENCEDEDEIDIKFLEVSAKTGTNIYALFEEIAVKLLDKHHKFLLSKGIKPNQLRVDPTQNMSYNYGHAQLTDKGEEGPGHNRIEIVDITGDYKKYNSNKDKKDDSCCKSC